MVVKGTVPDGEYGGLLFDIGMPCAQHRDDPSLAASCSDPRQSSD